MASSPGAQATVSDTQQHAGRDANITTTNNHYGPTNNLIVGSKVESVSDPVRGLLQHAALGALHNLNAEERLGSPRCHEGTRVAILDIIDQWARNDSVDAMPILWLRGAAGSGKSAICQTIIERWRKENYVVPNFFLWRTAVERNKKTYVIPTIAFQLTKLLPTTKPFIEEAVRDGTIFKGGFRAQIEALIIHPLKEANVDNRLVVIVVDGLDECCANLPSIGGFAGQAYEDQQREILEALAMACDGVNSLRVLVASRPEHQISKSFTVLWERLILVSLYDKCHLADAAADINLYLKFKFAEIRVGYPGLEPSWPSEQQMEQLIKKSSGHFIYPSVVIKYVSRPCQYPETSLEEVLACRPISDTQRSHPLAELDALYTFVLKTVSDDSLPTVKTVLGLMTYFPDVQGNFHPFGIFQNGPSSYNIASLAQFLSMKRPKLHHHLRNLHSIISMSESEDTTPDGSTITEVGFFHATLPEYLKDGSRCRNFFISRDETNLRISGALIKHIGTENRRRSPASVCDSFQLHFTLAHFVNISPPSKDLKEALWKSLKDEFGEYSTIADFDTKSKTSQSIPAESQTKYLQGPIFASLDKQMSCLLLKYLQACNIPEIEESESRRRAVSAHLAYLLNIVDSRGNIAEDVVDPRLNISGGRGIRQKPKWFWRKLGLLFQLALQRGKIQKRKVTHE